MLASDRKINSAFSLPVIKPVPVGLMSLGCYRDIEIQIIPYCIIFFYCLLE